MINFEVRIGSRRNDNFMVQTLEYEWSASDQLKEMRIDIGEGYRLRVCAGTEQKVEVIVQRERDRDTIR